VDALESAIVAAIGASGQVNAGRISSFSFADLKRYLAVLPGGTPAPETFTATLAVESALRDAEWVWFAMLDVTAEERPTPAVSRPALGPGVTPQGHRDRLAAPYYLTPPRSAS
jgi:hypothetical protein